ncbi:MAG: hypothetical protein IIB14_03180, partial [Chloroflexi bacterium]|nr:hypothetical protein [Chloroflexota bacterium]
NLTTGGAGNPIVSTLHGSGNTTDFYTWISLNTTTGVLTINATLNNQTGGYNISVDASDGGQSAGARIFMILGNATNDAPTFVNLNNKTFNMTTLFDYIINTTDEENDLPFTFNITFESCAVAAWSTRNCSGSYGNLTLFNSTQYTTNGTSGNRACDCKITEPAARAVGKASICSVFHRT